MKKQGKVQRGADRLKNELKLDQIFISRFYFKLIRHFSMIGVISMDIPDYVDPTQRYQIAAMKVA